MNQPGAPGQAAPEQGNAHPNQPAGGAPRPPAMYKPESMRQMPFLSEEEKGKYERGLRQLWNIFENSPQGSKEQLDARKKIMDFSAMLLGKLRQRKQSVGAVGHPENPGQGQSHQQQPHQQQPHQQQPQLAGLSVQQAATPQPPHAAGAAPGPSAIQQSDRPGTGHGPGAPAGAQQPQQYPETIMRHVNQMTYHPPPNVADKDPAIIQKWQGEMKSRYAKALMQMSSTGEQIKKIDQHFKDRAERNQPLADAERKMLEERRAQFQKGWAEAHKFVDQFRKQQEVLSKGVATGAGMAQARSQGGQPAGQPGRPGPSPQQQGQGGVPNPLQTSQSQMNAAIEAAKNQQLAAANRMPGANGQPGQHPPQGGPQVATGGSAAQPSPATPAPQAQPIKLEPGTQVQQPHPHPHPPAPVNTTIASAQAAAGIHSAGTPTQARVQTPLSAIPGGPPRSLSHQAALTLANQRGSQSGPSAAPGQPQPGQHPTPQTGGTPSSAAGVMGTAAAQGHPHAHPPQPQPHQTAGLTAKMPIPKNLPERATQAPQPVAIGGGINAGRPTYSGGSGIGGGVMGQPAVPKVPVIQLEGEGERVLNRKKLDELVRQVCGGQPEGQEGTSALTPDVEETVLNMADSFVDNVLYQACRNAKERGSKVLEIRDIQLVLERTYNIRIPGYSSDELRTVRKIQPAPGWITKMSAIQAAKVMPGKGDL